jgi:hypothetical protein
VTARQGEDEQACEPLPDPALEPAPRRGPFLLEAIEAGAVLEEEVRSPQGLGGDGGDHLA